MRKIYLLGVLAGFAAPVFAHDLTKGECEGAAESAAAKADRVKAVRDSAEKLAKFVKEEKRLPIAGEWAIVQQEGLADITGDETLRTEVLKVGREQFEKSFEVARNAWIRAFVKVSRSYGRMAREAELAKEMELGADKLVGAISATGLFTDLAQLKQISIEEKPDAFKFVFDDTIFNAERTKSLVTALESRRRIILTTAVAGAPVNLEFFAALQRYAKERDAEIVVYPANMQTGGLDPILLNTPGVHVLTNTMELSPWLALDRIKLMPKQINPLMGLDRTGPRGQSRIVGSPKMHMSVVATANNANHPHKLYTTGALTHPYYAGRLEISGRTDSIAAEDHFMGALIVEKSDSENKFVPVDTAGDFHVRRIEFIPEKKGFMDLSTFYTAEASTDVRPEALVLGDLHVGSTDQRLLERLRDQVLTLKPKTIVIHDLLDGQSVSHHERLKLVTLAKKAALGKLDLKNEILQVVTFLNSLLALDPKLTIKIIHSNHDAWIDRWLEDGVFMKEPHNTEIGLAMAQAKLSQGADPFEFAVRSYGLEYPKRVIFIKSSDTQIASLRFGPAHRRVEAGFHGHVMANGARGSLPSAQRGADRIIFGHTHTFGYRNGAVNTGTSTEKVLSYSAQGFSSWVQGLSLVGPNGEIQPLEFSNGEWYNPSTGPIDTARFFMPNYPEVVPNVESRSAGQSDQWNRH